MLVWVARCPSCKADVIVHRRSHPSNSDDLFTSSRGLYCVDCDTRLDRFGLAPAVRDLRLSALEHLGYSDLDRPTPFGPRGCFETTDCEGSKKIDSRPG